LKQIEPFNPFRRVEAETMAWGFGLKTRPHGVRNMVVTDIDNGEYLCLRGVDFGKKGAKKLSVCVASSKNGSCIKVRIDAKDGAVIGTLPVDSTGSDDSYSLLSCKLEKVKGIHDLYFTFEGDGEDLFNFDYWELK
ncbi:MAG: carbohydrate-binding protein, partial [Duncaniella sp.]|nr:carbohydrate-binding protein [Duncaniella sp.]